MFNIFLGILPSTAGAKEPAALGTGGHITREKINYGGTSDFWIHVTEYLKNPKFWGLIKNLIAVEKLKHLHL